MQISYTKSAQHALKYAARAAREMKHPYIGTEHLLLKFIYINLRPHAPQTRTLTGLSYTPNCGCKGTANRE